MTTTSLPTNSDGKLIHTVWPGLYPVYYIDNDNYILCPNCAQKSLDEADLSNHPQAYDVHYEGEPLVCEDCNCEIESAYGPVEVN